MKIPSVGTIDKWRVKTAIAAGVLIAAIVAVTGYVVLSDDHWTVEKFDGFSLGHPDKWVRQGAQNAVTFSPFPFDGQQPGASPEAWAKIIAALGSDPSNLIGVFVQEHSEAGFQSTNLETLKTAVAASLSDSRANLQAPVNSDQQVAGKQAIALEGDLRPWGSTDSLAIRSYVILLDESTGHSIHVMFFAAPAIFEESQETFTKVLASIGVA